MLLLRSPRCQPLKPSYTLVEATLILSAQPLFGGSQLAVNIFMPPTLAAEHPTPPGPLCAFLRLYPIGALPSPAPLPIGALPSPAPLFQDLPVLSFGIYLLWLYPL